ncbi:hypothetical protein ACF09E_13425 [Streptomyces sp. NPDC014891]|uniref:hypothetical protein n=1 Tax=Streptomyces sp. NPDC014891 TaxID=3364929 RepID=UPI0036F50B48
MPPRSAGSYGLNRRNTLVHVCVPVDLILVRGPEQKDVLVAADRSDHVEPSVALGRALRDLGSHLWVSAC